MTEIAPSDGASARILSDAITAAASQSLAVADLFAAVEALAGMGEAVAALHLYRTFIAFNPSHPLLYAALFNFSVLLAGSGEEISAIAALNEALRLNADFHPASINLGRLLEDHGQPAAAVARWTDLANRLSQLTGSALDSKITALQQIGRVLEGAGEDASAEEALKMSLDLRPDQVEVAQHWIALRMRQCKWPAIEPWERASRQQLLAGVSPLSLSNLADDPMFQLAVADRYCRKTVGMPPRREPVAPASGRIRDGSGRLRIGYVSSDLREHAVGFAMTDVLELHDRTAFEVHAYYCGIERDDATKQRSRAAVDRWTDISGLDDAAAAGRIAADGVDILVDLNGYTKSARTKVFALRPAPAVVNWFGFPGTMGSPYHHYIIADPFVVPEGQERFFSETVLRLPCYQPNDRRRAVASRAPTRRDENLPEDAVVFCCLNGMQKLTEATFDRWMTILRGVPAGVLWLLGGTPDTNSRLRDRAASRGVAGDRVIFAEKKANPDHLARYTLADLFLDTLPYGAHTTAADALWMGVPILTLPGRSFASRVCGSVVTAAGLGDMVVASPEDYVERAIALGRDRAGLAELKRRLAAQRDTCLLFDTPQLVRRLEDLYRTIGTDIAAGRVPAPRLDDLDVYHAIGMGLDLEGSEALSDAAYETLYREEIARWDDIYPLRPDGRFQKGRQTGVQS